jgi:hypothetical protein
MAGSGPQQVICERCYIERAALRVTASWPGDIDLVVNSCEACLDEVLNGFEQTRVNGAPVSELWWEEYLFD